MDKQFDMGKLFSEKLQNFEQETTPEFNQAMERKIDRLHWPKLLKWMIGVVMIAGLAVVVPFLINSSDNEETSITETQNEQIETKTTALPSSQNELELIEEKQTNNLTSDADILPQPESLEGFRDTLENFIVEDPSNEKASFETKSIDQDSDQEKIISEQKNISYYNTASLDYLNNQLAINSLSWDKPPNSLKKKQNLSPTTLLDEEFIAKEGAKAQKQSEKKNREIEKAVEKKEHQIAKEKRKAEKTRENEARKAQKEEEKKKLQAQMLEKQQKRKQPKIRKQKLPGIYEGAIEISAAPLFVKNLSPALEPKNDTVTNWLTNKNFKTSYDFGLELMFKQKESNWLVKTGLHYQKLSEEVNYYFLREYMDEELSHWIYDSIFEYHIDPPNFDTVLVGIDSSYYEHWERSETAQKHTNYYQYLNIPILLGYQIDLRKPTADPDYKKGFDIHVLMGTGLGILLKSEGYHYDNDGYIYTYPSKQKTTIDWYLNAQVAINYHWKNISLFAKPKLQFQMRERPFDSYFENRHYLMYGIDFGVRVKIFQ